MWCPVNFRVVRQILGPRVPLESRVRESDWRDSRAWDKSSNYLTNFNVVPPVIDESDDAIDETDETDEIDETSPDVDPRRWDAISAPRSSLE